MWQKLSHGMRWIVLIGVSLSMLSGTARAGSREAAVPAVAVQAIAKTYRQAGGEALLGEPVNSAPLVTELGCTQVYRNDGIETALVAAGCGGQVVTVEPPVWEYAKQIDPDELGIAISASESSEEIMTQAFQGGSWGPASVIVTPESTFALHGELLTYYQTADHSQALGQPTSEQYLWQGEQRQDFEQGSLVWRAEAGVRQLQQWANGQIIHDFSSSAAGFLIQGEGSYSYVDRDHYDRCRAGQAIAELSVDQLDLSLKQYPLAGQAADCQSAAETRAVAWAIHEKNSPAPAWSDQLGTWWSGRCEIFVELAYGTRARAASAMAHYQYQLRRGRIHTDTQPPAGAFVFYGGSSDGHVGLAVGNGQVVSTQGYSGERKPIWQHRVTGLSNPYLGWARYDGTWPR